MLLVSVLMNACEYARPYYQDGFSVADSQRTI